MLGYIGAVSLRARLSTENFFDQETGELLLNPDADGDAQPKGVGNPKSVESSPGTSTS